MTTPSARFRTTLFLGGKTATGFEVPAAAIETLGQGKRPPVRATINGYSYRTTVAVMGGAYMIPVAAEHREKAKIAAGEEIDVELVLDTAPREVAMPADLAAALKPHGDARKYYDGMSYTNRKEIVRGIEDAKTDATRQRRIEKAVNMLVEQGNQSRART